MATIVTYNGIEMHSVSTLRFQQTPQYDPSGTDVLFSRFTLAFEGLLHAASDSNGAPVWIGQTGGGSFPPVDAAYRSLMTTLWQPRGALEVDMGGVVIFQCSGPGKSSQFEDLDNGPKPKHVQLSHVTSSSAIGPTFRVSFEIECARSCCPSGNIQQVLDNRWAISEGFDEEFFTTRTIQGQIRIADNTLQADAYRYLVMPTLETGFRRERFDYNIQANGLAIDYVVTDKQIHTAAPWPATKINVRHTEGTANGAKFESECHVQLKGHPGASKISMFALGAKILEDRLGQIQSMGTNNAQVPVAFSMTDVSGERNEVELYLKVQSSINAETNDGLPTTPADFFALPVGTMGRPIGSMISFNIGDGTVGNDVYDPTNSAVPNPWGYDSQAGDTPRQSAIVALALQCYLQWPCDNNHAIPGQDWQNGSQPQRPTQPLVTQSVSVQQWGQGFSVPNLQSKETQTAIYTFCAAETTLEANPLRVALPIAGSPSQYQAGADTCVAVTLGWTKAQIVFHFECERVGQWPTIPEPIGQFLVPNYPGDQGGASGTNITGCLLRAKIVPLPATVDATSSKAIYHVSCVYVYALNRPPTRAETIPVGVLPFTNFTPSQNALTLSSMYGGVNAGTYQDSGKQTNAGGY